MWDRIEFLFSEAFTALRRNILMSLAAITTSCVALFLTGGVGFAIKGVNEYAATLPSRFEVRVFLKDRVDQDQIKATAEQIREIPGVASAVLLPREAAWQRFKQENPDYPTTGLENPLPDAFNVRLTNVDDIEVVAGQIKKIPTVSPGDGVQFLRREREMLSQAISVLRLVGIALGGMMLITGAILIYNTIRMTIVARRREFRIMRLVGATRATIVVPLLIEGMMHGMAGAILASMMVKGAHQFLANQLESFSGVVRVGPLDFNQVFGVMLTLGLAYGLACSLFAVRGKME